MGISPYDISPSFLAFLRNAVLFGQATLSRSNTKKKDLDHRMKLTCFWPTPASWSSLELELGRNSFRPWPRSKILPPHPNTSPSFLAGTTTQKKQTSHKVESSGQPANDLEFSSPTQGDSHTLLRSPHYFLHTRLSSPHLNTPTNHIKRTVSLRNLLPLTTQPNLLSISNSSTPPLIAHLIAHKMPLPTPSQTTRPTQQQMASTNEPSGTPNRPARAPVQQSPSASSPSEADGSDR